MANIGTATIQIDPELGRLTLVLRVLSKHLSACADELDTLNHRDADPPPKIRSWRNGEVIETEGGA
jgi:hypothetical protein